MLPISCFPALSSEPLETSPHVRPTWHMQAQEGSPGFCNPPLWQGLWEAGNWGWLGFYYMITAFFGDVMKQHQLRILNVLLFLYKQPFSVFLQLQGPILQAKQKHKWVNIKQNKEMYVWALLWQSGKGQTSAYPKKFSSTYSETTCQVKT